MSFGYRDEDWVYPDEPNGFCCDCEHFNLCPGGCGWGWCTEIDSWCETSDEACDGFMEREDE